MKKLYVAEKPDQAAALAACMGEAVKKDGYYQSGDCYIVWLYGHVLVHYDPKEYSEKYAKWSLENLPIVPDRWMKKIGSGKAYKRSVDTIMELSKLADIIVNAGDPDREGQLLVDEVLEFIGNSLPVKRIYVNALDAKSVKEALAVEEDNNAPNNRCRYYAGLARERLDWLYGYNATRKFTLTARLNGYDKVLHIGRVKTPTLALVVRRNREIAAFRPVKYYVFTAYFRRDDSLMFPAVWQPKNCPGRDEADRVVDATFAREVEQKLKNGDGRAVVVSSESKSESEPAPLPFSLSKLQQVAGAVYKYSPMHVLELAQKLYEKKLTSYPRSSCRYLPESQLGDGIKIIANLKVAGDHGLFLAAEGADAALKSPAFNNSKIDAHHAIIPTTVRVDLLKLPEDERNLYVLICKSYLAQFYPAYAYEQSTVLIEMCGEQFKAIGRLVINNGWREVLTLTEDKKKDEPKKLPQLAEGDMVILSAANIADRMTKPLPVLTKSTLVGLMENIHKVVDDAQIKRALADSNGLGTDATRAAIIEDLFKQGYLREEKGRIFATEAGEILVDVLPKALTGPEQTGLMEAALDDIANGKVTLEEYMSARIRDIHELMNLEASFTGKFKVYGCPDCGKPLRQINGKKSKFWGCTGWKDGCKATFNDKNNQPVFGRSLK